MKSDFELAQAFARSLKHLPAMPAIAQRALAMLGRPDTTTQQLAELIAHDPSITARVLRYANAPYFGARRQIRDLVSAIVVLGYTAATEIVSAASLVDWYGKDEDVQAQASWRRSLKIAALASRLARRIYAGHGASETFIAGLMHDIGRSTLRTTRSMLAPIGASSRRAEDAYWISQLGFSSCDLGAALVHSWNLAEEVEITARYCEAHAPFATVRGECAVVLALVMTAIVLTDGESFTDEEALGAFAVRLHNNPVGEPLRRAFLATRREARTLPRLATSTAMSS